MAQSVSFSYMDRLRLTNGLSDLFVVGRATAAIGAAMSSSLELQMKPN